MLTEQVRRFSEKYGLLAEGDRVLAALSGGADSVCLLLVLHELAPELALGLRALHLHHGLRGAEADRDAEFSERLCARLGIPFLLVRRDAAAYAREHGCSTEEAGRLLRYGALEEAAGAWEDETPGLELPHVKIAVAHHRDDNAETILHHLLRGSGLRGLSGMRPAQGRRIRPLLCAGREEIRAFLAERGQDWCEDSTNAEPDYTRNRIRNEILPLLAREVNARASENILRAGELFGQADAWLTEQAEAVLCCPPGPRERVRVPVSVFLAQPAVLRSYVVHCMLDRTAPGQKDLTSKHFSLIARLAESRPGASCDLPGGLGAWRDPDALWVGRRPEQAETVRPAGAEDFRFRVFEAQKGMEIPKNPYTKWFDYDKIKGILSVRTRRSGDYIGLSGGGRKRVNRCMIDGKIPRGERDRIPLLAEGSHVLWIVGYRISDDYKISAETRKVLQVKMIAAHGPLSAPREQEPETDKGEENG